ncbi:MAG: Tox-REase-5 domain-containing protein [Rhodospirillales bacterium]
MDRWRVFQERVTKMDSDLEIMLNGVSFDGCRNVVGGIVLLEAKGPGFAEKLEEDGDFPFWYDGRRKLAIQMKKQSIAAGKNRVEWHVAEKQIIPFLTWLAEKLECGNIDVMDASDTDTVAP